MEPQALCKMNGWPLNLSPICHFVKHGILRSHFKIPQIGMSLTPPWHSYALPHTEKAPYTLQNTKPGSDMTLYPENPLQHMQVSLKYQSNLILNLFKMDWNSYCHVTTLKSDTWMGDLPDIAYSGALTWKNESKIWGWCRLVMEVGGGHITPFSDWFSMSQHLYKRPFSWFNFPFSL